MTHSLQACLVQTDRCAAGADAASVPQGPARGNRVPALCSDRESNLAEVAPARGKGFGPHSGWSSLTGRGGKASSWSFHSLASPRGLRPELQWPPSSRPAGGRRRGRWWGAWLQGCLLSSGWHSRFAGQCHFQESFPCSTPLAHQLVRPASPGAVQERRASRPPACMSRTLGGQQRCRSRVPAAPFRTGSLRG